jgi:hypothetical protein
VGVKEKKPLLKNNLAMRITADVTGGRSITVQQLYIRIKVAWRSFKPHKPLLLVHKIPTLSKKSTHLREC